MTPTKEETDFIVAAARLKKLCHAYDIHAWDDFIAGLSQYADRGFSMLLQANARLEYAQGYANARLHILEQLVNCVKLAETARK